MKFILKTILFYITAIFVCITFMLIPENNIEITIYPIIISTLLVLICVTHINKKEFEKITLLYKLDKWCKE